MAGPGDDVNARPSDLYEELARVRSLLEYYELYPYGSREDRLSFTMLTDLLRKRQREIVKKLAELQKRGDEWE